MCEIRLKLFETPAEELDYSFVAKRRNEGLRGACVYCGHCMPCPQGIDIAAVNKFLDLYEIGDKMAKSHYDTLSRHASGCDSCGNCSEQCPLSSFWFKFFPYTPKIR
jgi:predicted aldo/keto reductase-like oxidoreductase